MKHTTTLPGNSISVKKLPTAYQLTQAPERKRPTLSRVLYDKFLVWLQEANTHKLLKLLKRSAIFVVTVLAFIDHNLLLQIFQFSFSIHNYALVKIVSVLTVAYNWKAFWRAFQHLRARCKRGKGNQHTFHGVPVPELCDFLMRHRKFTRGLAIAKLALTQGQYHKIKDELRKHSILIRGENNAFVLNLITRELLQRQLRENFPSVWRSDSQEWIEKEGFYNTFARERDRSEPNVKENWFTSRKLEMV